MYIILIPIFFLFTNLQDVSRRQQMGRLRHQARVRNHAIVSFFLFCSPLFCFLFFNIQIVSDYYLTSPTKNSIRQGEGAVVGRPMMIILVGFEPMEKDSSPVEEPPAVDLSDQRQSTIRIQI